MPVSLPVSVRRVFPFLGILCHGTLLETTRHDKASLPDRKGCGLRASHPLVLPGPGVSLADRPIPDV